MRLLPDDPELGWTPYAYLVYAAVFVFVHLHLYRTWPAVAVLLVAIGFFLVLYFRSFWLPAGPRMAAPIAGIALLGVLFLPFNWAGGTFFIYAGAFAPRIGPPARAWKLIGALIAVLLAEAWTLGISPYAWVPALVFTPLIGGLNIHQQEIRRANADLRRSREEVTRLAEVAERERIGRDLHDLLGHTLTLITLKAELAAKLADRDPQRAAQEIREVEAVSRQALEEVRRAVTGYRGDGLPAELANAERALAAAGVDLVVERQPLELDRRQEQALAFVLREAVTNVVRHAAAGRCRVELTGSEGAVRLAITDDGHGAEGPEGAGVRGMRERLAELGGALELGRGPAAEGGTRVLATLPPTAAAGRSG